MTTVAQALSMIIDRFGINSFNDPNQVQAMVLDYIGSLSTSDVEVFCICCRKEMLSIAQEMYESRDVKNTLFLAHKAKTFLLDRLYLQEKYAVLCVNMFLEGTGKQVRLNFDLSPGYNRNSSRAKIASQAGKERKTIINNSLHEATECKQQVDRMWFQLLYEKAQTGDIAALIQLGDCYQHGIIVKANRTAAEYFFGKARQLSVLCGDVRMIKIATRKLILLRNLSQR